MRRDKQTRARTGSLVYAKYVALAVLPNIRQTCFLQSLQIITGPLYFLKRRRRDLVDRNLIFYGLLMIRRQKFNPGLHRSRSL